MKHADILNSLDAPSVKLIASDNAPLILGFFSQEFLEDLRLTLPLDTFTEHLDIYLEELHVHSPHLYRDTAKNYVKQWSDDKGWLRIYRPGSSHDYVVELTVHAQHALKWIDDLKEREFLGTESRFSQIVALLSEIVSKSNTTPEKRIHQLEVEKERIEREIERIKLTGQIERLTPSQIRERIQLASEQVSQLLRDFTAVEEHFREIATLVQQEQLKPDARKGLIVGKVLDADEKVRDSEVGRSFYAFWDFLQRPSQRDELNRLLQSVFSLDDLTLNPQQTTLLRDMPRYLIEAGVKVDRSNQRLAEQLRRMLDENHIAESRRIQTLISEIKHLIHEKPEILDTHSQWLEVETLPNTHLPMEQKLWSPRENVQFDIDMLEEAEISDLELNLDEIIDVFYIDEQEIKDRIENILTIKHQISLLELLEEYPIQKGLPEVLTYLQIASQANQQAEVDIERKDELIIMAVNGEPLRLALPHITFRRIADG